jgi:thymidine phosphorylase
MVRLGDKVAINDILYLVFSEAEGELNYALDYVKAQKEIIKIEA